MLTINNTYKNIIYKLSRYYLSVRLVVSYKWPTSSRYIFLISFLLGSLFLASVSEFVFANNQEDKKHLPRLLFIKAHQHNDADHLDSPDTVYWTPRGHRVQMVPMADDDLIVMFIQQSDASASFVDSATEENSEMAEALSDINEESGEMPFQLEYRTDTQSMPSTTHSDPSPADELTSGGLLNIANLEDMDALFTTRLAQLAPVRLLSWLSSLAVQSDHQQPKVQNSIKNRNIPEVFANKLHHQVKLNLMEYHPEAKSEEVAQAYDQIPHALIQAYRQAQWLKVKKLEGLPTTQQYRFAIYQGGVRKGEPMLALAEISPGEFEDERDWVLVQHNIIDSLINLAHTTLLLKMATNEPAQDIMINSKKQRHDHNSLFLSGKGLNDFTKQTIPTWQAKEGSDLSDDGSNNSLDIRSIRERIWLPLAAPDWLRTIHVFPVGIDERGQLYRQHTGYASNQYLYPTQVSDTSDHSSAFAYSNERATSSEVTERIVPCRRPIDDTGGIDFITCQMSRLKIASDWTHPRGTPRQRIQHEDYQDELIRRESFFDWKVSYGIDSENLVKSGCYHTPKDDRPDSVTCFHCGVELFNWEDGDSLIDRHLELDCQFLDGLNGERLKELRSVVVKKEKKCRK